MLPFRLGLGAVLLSGLVAVNLAASSGDRPPKPLFSNSSSSIWRQATSSWERFTSDAQGNNRLAHIIAVLKDRDLINRRFMHVCGQDGSDAQHPDITKIDQAQVPEACWALRGACQRTFKTSLIGLSGRFNQLEFAALLECAGEGGILYIGRDGQVKKAEGQAHRRWWTFRPPTNMTVEMLQQLAASKLGAAAAAGVAAGTSKAATSGNKSAASKNNVHATDGPAYHGTKDTMRVNSAQLALVQRWLLAEIGLAAQKQLQSGRPLVELISPAVKAADAEPGDEAALVTAGGGDDAQSNVSAGTPRGSKNQDPGIAVDPQAVAKPDITVRTTGTRSSSAGSDIAEKQEVEQPLSLKAAEQANEEPGLKEQRLQTALWNLDRIDQRTLPLDGMFNYGSSSSPGTGKGVTIYILDSGIRKNHQEFQPWDGSGPGRATTGPDFVDDDDVADDCDGHGTHVASTAAGRSVGVAKEAKVVAVRVLDCDGSGSVSNVVAALDWVAQNAVKPAVVSLSLGVPAGSWSKPLEDAVRHITDTIGIPVVVAAGNSAKDSCGVAPGRVPSVITVAASNLPNKFGQTRAGDTENLYSWSNTGECVALFAPGVDIYGACGGASRCVEVNDSSYTWASGTSMAAPHVTGAAAVYLESHPHAKPDEVRQALKAQATEGRLADPAMLPDTPNLLLFSSEAGSQAGNSNAVPAAG